MDLPAADSGRGVFEPNRTHGGTRRYSAEDLDRLKRIGELLNAGLNLAGIALVLGLEADRCPTASGPTPSGPTPSGPTASGSGRPRVLTVTTSAPSCRGGGNRPAAGRSCGRPATC